MEIKINHLDSLVETMEEYGKTSFELARLVAVKKTAKIISSAIPTAALVVIGSLFMFSVTMGMSLWIGDLLGKSWKGFFCVAGFYALGAILISFFLREPFRRRVNRLLVLHLLN
jgi:hypothetical protein